MSDKKENKYAAGDIVYEKVNPDVKLVVRRNIDGIYFCKFYDDPKRKELPLFERELFSK